jgi:FkbM family methyltransferase
MRSIKIRHLNRYLLNKVGLHLTKMESSPTLQGLLRKIQLMPLEITTVFDVGAYRGTWSEEVRRIFPKASFVLFEPNEVHNGEISKRKFRVYNLVLGRLTGSKVKFYSSGSTGDSFFLEKNDFYIGKEKELEVFSLTDVIEKYGLQFPDFLKLDTQGSEMEILLGAKDVLHQIKLILVELPITKMNIGAPSLSEIVEYLENQNFVPIHLSEIHNLIDILVQVDIAFLRRDLFISIYGHDDITHRSISPNL